MDEVIQAKPWEKFQPKALPTTQTKPWEKFKQGASESPETSLAPVAEEPLTVDSVLSRFGGRGLTRQDFLENEDLMTLVEKNLNQRRQDGTLIDPEADKRTAEEKFDTWLNYHRSLSAGNSVSLANEIAYAAGAEQDRLQALGEGYKLFDSLDNALIGEGTWTDTADAVGDYLYYSVVDPMTIVSLGVGKVFAQAGTKGASMALRTGAKAVFEASIKASAKKGITGQAAQAAAEAAAKQVMQQGFSQIGTKKLRSAATTQALKEITESGVKAGMTQQAARLAAQKAINQTAAAGTLDLAKKEAMRFAVASYGTDAIVAVGADAAFQHTRMITGVQEDFSIPQTAIAAMGALVTPAAAAGVRGVGKGLRTILPKSVPEFDAVTKAMRGRDPVQSLALMQSMVDLNKVNSNLRGSVKSFVDNLDKSTNWLKSMERIEAAKGLNSDQPLKEFYSYLTLGHVDKNGNTVNGYTYELANAGLYYVDRYEGDNLTNFLADAIAWMDPKVFEAFAKGYESKAGVSLGLKNYDPKDAAQKIRESVRLGAQSLNVSSQNAKILATKDNLSTVQKALGIKPGKDPESSAYGQWMLSIWKRLVTSHPATTAANLKGWVGLSLLNTTSDLVQGTLEYGAGTFLRLGGRASGRDLQKLGSNTLLSVARRGGAILNWDATVKEGQELLAQLPKVREELSKTLTGDIGMAASGSAIKDFNLADNALTRGTERYIDIAQNATGVILQDQVTKMMSLMSSLDRQILRHYGKTYDEFMAEPDVWVKMASPEFQTEVLARALDRTQRETASKSWSDKKGSNTWLMGAKIVEQLSNSQYTGYLIPFGRFFNTSMAVIGDFSVFNAIRHSVFKKSKVDKSQDEGLELWAKGITGWGLVAGMGYMAQEKIENGLAWNQVMNADGSISDETYDFPESYIRIAAQVSAHIYKDSSIPKPLYEELLQVYGANVFRASQEGLQAVQDVLAQASGGDVSAAGWGALDIVKGFMAGIINGATRPLDVPNQVVGVATGNVENIDRRQGDVFTNEALRYIDKIFPVLEGEQRYSPTKGVETHTDLGKTLFGARTTAENTTVDKLLNSVGQAPWQAIKWEGPPEVKNRMDALIAPMLNAYANKLLEKHPDFFKLRLEQRQMLVSNEVITPAKESAKRMLRSGAGSGGTLPILEALGKKPKGDVRKVLNYLGQEGDLSDIAKMDGGKEKLETILYLVENWERIIAPR